MMTWRVAKSLLAMRDQVNAGFPGRAKGWDGTIGDAAHASRSSDHNPWFNDASGIGIVSGMDITNDPPHGLVSRNLAQHLLDSRDNRIKYVISNRQIAAGADGPSPWVWRPYNGPNPHDHHCHISVKEEAVYYDDPHPWLGVTHTLIAPNIKELTKPITHSKIANTQIATGAVTAVTTAGSVYNAFDTTQQTVSSVSNIVDQSGTVVAQAKTVIDKVPHGFVENMVAVLSSHVFQGCVGVMIVVACGLVFYWRKQMQTPVYQYQRIPDPEQTVSDVDSHSEQDAPDAG